MSQQEKRKRQLLEDRKHVPSYSKSKSLNRRIFKMKNSKCKGKPLRIMAERLKLMKDRYPDLEIKDSALIHAESVK